MYKIGTVRKSNRTIDIQVTIQPIPTQRKKSSTPLTRKSGTRITKTYRRKTNNKFRQMFRRTIHKPGSDNSEIRQNSKNSTRFQKTKRCHTQKQISNAKHRPPNGLGSSIYFRKKNKPGQYFFSKIDLK